MPCVHRDALRTHKLSKYHLKRVTPLTQRHQCIPCHWESHRADQLDIHLNCTRHARMIAEIAAFEAEAENAELSSDELD
jgi:hypothetical protein